MSQDQNERSWLWILLPVFLGMPGGLLTYFAIKNDDLRLARISLYVGVSTTIIVIPFMVILIVSQLMMLSFMDMTHFAPIYDSQSKNTGCDNIYYPYPCL